MMSRVGSDKAATGPDAFGAPRYTAHFCIAPSSERRFIHLSKANVLNQPGSCRPSRRAMLRYSGAHSFQSVGLVAEANRTLKTRVLGSRSLARSISVIAN